MGFGVWGLGFGVNSGGGGGGAPWGFLGSLASQELLLQMSQDGSGKVQKLDFLCYATGPNPVSGLGFRA